MRMNKLVNQKHQALAKLAVERFKKAQEAPEEKPEPTMDLIARANEKAVEYSRLRKLALEVLSHESSEEGCVEFGIKPEDDMGVIRRKVVNRFKAGNHSVVRGELKTLFPRHEEDIYEPAEVTKQDVADMALLFGAEWPTDEAFGLFGVTFDWDNAGRLVVNGKKALRNVIAVFGGGMPHELFQYQTAALVLLAAQGAAAQERERFASNASPYQVQKALTKAFQKVINSGPVNKGSEQPAYGFVDATCALRLKEIVRPIEVLLVEDSIVYLEQIDPILGNKMVKELHPDYGVDIESGNYRPAGKMLDENHIAVRSSDGAKSAKRTRMASGEQQEPVNPVLSRVSYRGTRATGSLITAFLAPCADPFLAGGPGGSLDLSGETGVKTSYWDDALHSGTSFDIRSAEDREAFLNTLPSDGDVLGETLSVFGAPPVKVPSDARGVVTKVTAAPDGAYRNMRWQVHSRFKETSVFTKLRGSIKTMVSAGLVAKIRLGEGSITHFDIRNSGLALSGWEGEDLFLSGDAFKGTGKGNSQFRVEVAVETIWHFLPLEADSLLSSLLPEALYKGGIVEYDEAFDLDGAYEPLMREFERRFAKVADLGKTVELPEVWDKWLLEHATKVGLKVEDLVWSPFQKEGVTGKQVAFNIGKGITGLPEYRVFVLYDDGCKAVVRTTTAFKTAMLVRVEYGSVRKAASKAQLMLEVAYGAKAMGLDELAEFLEYEGRSKARAVLKLIRSVGPKAAIAEGSRVIDAAEATDEDLLEIETLLESDLEAWPEDLVIECKFEDKNGKLWRVVLAHHLVSVISKENPQRKAISGILDAILNKDRTRFENNIRVLEGGLSNMVSLANKKLWKKVHAGPNAAHGKRVIVLASHVGCHEELLVNPFGKNARHLAKQNGCEIKELDGRWVVVQRAPQSLPILLRIVLTTAIGKNVFGMTDLAASIDNGDHDGDTILVTVIPDQIAEVTLQKYNARRKSLSIHEGTHKADPYHWIEQNTFVDGKHNVWARPSVVTVENLRKYDEAGIRAYTLEMPSDANRAHLALAIASMQLPTGWGEFSIEEANGLMFSVYEPELGGFNPKFAAAHAAIANLGNERLKEFLQATDKLDLREDFAKAWLRSADAKSWCQKTVSYAKFNSNGKLSVWNLTQATVPQEQRLAAVPRLVAFAMKLLSVGNVNNQLMLNLDKVVVESMVKETKGENRRYYPVLVKGKPEVVELKSVIKKLAAKGVPGAQRLEIWMDHILPEFSKYHPKEYHAAMAFNGDYDCSDSEEE